jgi:hypothetical protein
VHTQESQKGGEEVKFYIIKRDEREGDGYKQIVEFDTVEDLQQYINYNAGYIEEMRTLDSDINYDIEGAE